MEFACGEMLLDLRVSWGALLAVGCRGAMVVLHRQVLCRRVLRLQWRSQTTWWLGSADIRSVAFRKVRWFCIVDCGIVLTKGVWYLCYARCVVIIHGHWLTLMQGAWKCLGWLNSKWNFFGWFGSKWKNSWDGLVPSENSLDSVIPSGNSWDSLIPSENSWDSLIPSGNSWIVWFQMEILRVIWFQVILFMVECDCWYRKWICVYFNRYREC